MGPFALALDTKNSFAASSSATDASGRKMDNLQMVPKKFFASINNEEEKPFDFLRILFGMSAEIIIEKEKGQLVTGIECYMQENNLCVEEASAQLSEIAESAWKDLNKECIKSTDSMPTDILMRVVNLTHLIDVVYTNNQDGYSDPKNNVKSVIEALLVNPINLYLGKMPRGSSVISQQDLPNLVCTKQQVILSYLMKKLNLSYEDEHHHKMLVYEYVNNGNLEQWLHGAMRHHMYLTWKARMKVLLGTAKASLILVWPNCLVPVKVISQLESTFGYVAPKYANIGLLNEKNDIYSFGGSVVRIDHTGRDRVDYGHPSQEVRYPSYLILRSN
ncbi:hypothetical protein KY285_022309 [Solanum tuberosum]|nr:hypothetical protein KY285_022309 [Solanum tuberosum]